MRKAKGKIDGIWTIMKIVMKSLPSAIQHVHAILHRAICPKKNTIHFWGLKRRLCWLACPQVKMRTTTTGTRTLILSLSESPGL